MSELGELIQDALAVHRITRLVTADVITQAARDRLIEVAYLRAGRVGEVKESGADVNEEGVWQTIVEGDPHPPKLATLVTCRWCAGMYVAAGVVAARLVAPRAWRKARAVLALSSAAALLAALEDE